MIADRRIGLATRRAADRALVAPTQERRWRVLERRTRQRRRYIDRRWPEIQPTGKERP